MSKKAEKRISKVQGDIEIIKDNLEQSEVEYINELEQRDETEEQDAVFFDLFNNLVNTIIVADKISSIVKKTMDEVDNDIITVPSYMHKNMFSQSITAYNQITKDINDMVMLIHNFSGQINYFWKDCPVEVFQNHYEQIKNKYIEKYVYANEIDFLKYEYQYFLDEDDIETNTAHSEVRSIDYLSGVNYKKYLTYDNKQFFSLLNTRKIEFLKTQIDKLGYNIEILVVGGKQKVNILETNIPKADDLALTGLPKFNIQQRYELFKKLGFEKTIHTLNTDKQMTKYKVLAIILGINPDNAKQLFNGTYKGLSSKDENLLLEFLNNQQIKI